MKERIALYDNLKFFLIVCVIIGHSSSYFFEYPKWVGVYYFIYSFHMPAFIFLSGLFSKKTIEANAIKKALPYLSIYAFMKFLFFFFSYFSNYKNNRLNYIPMNFLSEAAVPWFCLSLFFMHLITMCLKKYRKSFVLALSLIASCLAGYLGGDPDFLIWLRTLTFYPFFYLGYLLDPDKIAEKLSGIKFRIGSLFILVSLFFAFVFYNIRWNNVYNLFTGRHFYSELTEYRIGGAIFRFGTFLLSLALTFMLISVVPRISLPVFSKAGRRTLPIYVFHECFIHFVYTSFGMSRLPSLMPYGWQFIIVAISIAIALLCSNFVFNRIVKKIASSDWKLKKEEALH